MTKQVMTILSATDKKIKTLYPEKVAARIESRKAFNEALKTITAGTEDEEKSEEAKKADPTPLKLNRKIRRHMSKMTRQMRKAEVRANNEKRYEEKLAAEAKNEQD